MTESSISNLGADLCSSGDCRRSSITGLNGLFDLGLRCSYRSFKRGNGSGFIDLGRVLINFRRSHNLFLRLGLEEATDTGREAAANLGSRANLLLLLLFFFSLFCLRLRSSFSGSWGLSSRLLGGRSSSNFAVFIMISKDNQHAKLFRLTSLWWAQPLRS